MIKGSFFSAFLFCFLLIVYNITLGQTTIDPDPNEYSFFPGSVLSLGRGISPNDVSAPKQPCLIFEKDSLEYGSITTQFHTYLVTNSSSLNVTLNIDTKADASFLIYKADGSFNLAASYLNKKNSIYLIISGISELGRLSIKPGFHYTTEAKNLLKDPLKFCDVCGEKYALIERRGVSISAVITLENLSDEEMLDITTNGDFSGGFSIVSGSMSLKTRNYLKRVAQRGNIDVSVFATGGEGISALDGTIRSLATDVNSLDKIQDALANFIKTLDRKNSVPIGFQMAKFPGLDLEEKMLWNTRQESKLRDLVFYYRKYLTIENNLDDIINKRNAVYKDFDNTELIQLQAYNIKVSNFLQKIADFHRNLKDRKISYNNILISEPKVASTLSNKLELVTAKPKTYRQVYVDGTECSLNETRAIIGGPDSHRTILERARHFYPNAKEVKMAIVITGYKLDLFQYKFRNADGSIRPITAYKINNNKFIWYYDEINKVDFKPYLENGSGSGDYFIEIVDKFNRSLQVNIRNVKWDNVDRSTKIIADDYDL